MSETRTPAEIAAAERKATADARAAEVAADAARIDLDRKTEEFEEWRKGRDLREAEARANARALDLKNADSERAAIQAMVPDLGKVELGSTSVAESSTVFGALLGGRALQDAASKLIPVIKGDSGLGDDYRVLVTTDMELAARDAGYLSVIGQLDQLRGLIDRFLDRIRPLGAVESAAVAASSLLPGLLSLISARRSITVSNTTVDNDTAMLAVAGALAGADAEGTVVLDRVRILKSDGAAQTAWAALQSACQRLSAELETEEAKPEPDAGWAAEGRSLLKTCQAALLAMTTVPEGATLTPLARSALQEALHSDEFQGVLVVKGAASSSTQLVDDRPLRFGDPLSVVSTATIAYALIDHRNGSRVLRAGLANGAAQTWGNVGSRLEMPN